MNFCFGDIVVVDDGLIGVVVKSWCRSSQGNEPSHDVYVRMYNGIKNYPESKMQRYMVRHKYLLKKRKSIRKMQWRGYSYARIQSNLQMPDVRTLSE